MDHFIETATFHDFMVKYTFKVKKTEDGTEITVFGPSFLDPDTRIMELGYHNTKYSESYESVEAIEYITNVYRASSDEVMYQWQILLNRLFCLFFRKYHAFPV